MIFCCLFIIQQARKPYEVRDVIEQYSQGNMDIMIRLKELHRRIDQILGVPKTTISDRDRVKYTVNARLSRIEDHVRLVDSKLDECLAMLRLLPEVKLQIERQQQQLVQATDQRISSVD